MCAVFHRIIWGEHTHQPYTINCALWARINPMLVQRRNNRLAYRIDYSDYSEARHYYDKDWINKHPNFTFISDLPDINQDINTKTDPEINTNRAIISFVELSDKEGVCAKFDFNDLLTLDELNKITKYTVSVNK